jgi:hypothetical protein
MNWSRKEDVPVRAGTNCRRGRTGGSCGQPIATKAVVLAPFHDYLWRIHAQVPHAGELVKAYQSEEVRKFIQAEFKGAVVPGF